MTQESSSLASTFFFEKRDGNEPISKPVTVTVYNNKTIYRILNSQHTRHCIVSIWSKQLPEMVLKLIGFPEELQCYILAILTG